MGGGGGGRRKCSRPLRRTMKGHNLSRLDVYCCSAAMSALGTLVSSKSRVGGVVLQGRYDCISSELTFMVLAMGCSADSEALYPAFWRWGEVGKRLASASWLGLRRGEFGFLHLWPNRFVLPFSRPKKLTLKGYKQYWCTFKDITISCYKSKEEAQGTPAHQMNLRGESILSFQL